MGSEAYERALELLRSGQGESAVSLLEQACAEVAVAFGEDGPEFAAAAFDLARLLITQGDLDRAAEWLRRANTTAAPDRAALRDRLTYNMNWGEVLLRQGRLHDAENVLRRGLDERARLYGVRHAGYAYGLAALADVLRARGAFEEALEGAERAVDVFWTEGNAEVVAAMALRAVVAAQLGQVALDRAHRLPDETFERLIEAFIARRELDDPRMQQRVLLELDAHTIARFGEDDPWRIRIASVLVEMAGRTGDHRTRVARSKWIVDAMRRRGDLPSEIEALLGLAVANADAGDKTQAEQSYRRAIERANLLHDPSVVSRVRRHFGLFLADIGNLDGSAEQLERAIVVARRGNDLVALGRAQIALGIQLQHRGELARAQALLEAGVERLEPTDMDALYGRDHFDALLKGRDCGCDQLEQAIGDAVRFMVADAVSDTLIEGVEVRIDPEAGPAVSVVLRRDPTEAEDLELDRAVRRALIALQHKLRRRGVG